MTSPRSAHALFLAAAPLIFAVTWSTGNIFTKYGMPYVEPLTFLALRFAFGTLFLVAVAAAVRAPWPGSAAEAGHVIVAGVLVHGGYLWSVFVAVDEGVAIGTLALIVGLQPLLTATIVGRALGERVTAIQWIGFVLGFVGVVMVVWRKIDLAEGTLFGMALGVTSVLALTVGTVYQKRFCADMDLRSGTALQQGVNAAITLGLVLMLETRVIDWTSEFVFSLFWLVFVLTIGAYNLLFYLLRLGEASRVASMFYLTPAITAAMGYLMFDEILGPVSLIGMAVAVTGFALASR